MNYTQYYGKSNIRTTTTIHYHSYFPYRVLSLSNNDMLMDRDMEIIVFQQLFTVNNQ